MPLRAPKGFIDESDPKVCQIGHPAPPWLVNYADLMTELVCFFVILYALGAALNKNAQAAKQEIDEMIKEGKASGDVKIDNEGLKISLTDKGDVPQFQSGFAELTPQMKAQIDAVADPLKKLADSGNEIIVQGHTDNVPIHNDYFWGNWELSSARATSVVEYLINEKHFPPGCVAAMGYGDARPVVPNDTPEDKAKNRRVVFFVKNPPMKGNKCDATPPKAVPVPPPPPPGAQPGQEKGASG